MTPSALEGAHRRLRHALHCADQRAERGRVGVEDVARGQARDDEGMAFPLGHHVHEGDDVVVLIDPVRRDLAAEDLREDVLVVVGRLRHGPSGLPLPARMPVRAAAVTREVAYPQWAALPGADRAPGARGCRRPGTVCAVV